MVSFPLPETLGSLFPQNPQQAPERMNKTCLHKDTTNLGNYRSQPDPIVFKSGCNKVVRAVESARRGVW